MSAISIQSKNALFVVRSVLSGRYSAPSARLSSCASVSQKDDTADFFSFLTPPRSKSNTAAPAPPLDFLEHSQEEYDDVRAVLPERDLSARPIPWPTLFAPKITKYNKDRQYVKDGASSTVERPPLLCDTLHRVVLQGDYTAARRVLEELQRIGHTPHARKAYINPALACLYARNPDKEGFLMWLSLYPNRPAVRSYKAIQVEWMPVVEHLKVYHTFDLDFLQAFLVQAGKLGLLPVVFEPLIRHITLIFPPSTSLAVFQSAVKAYYISTTPKSSTSDRAKLQRAVADEQSQNWWNKYVRQLLSVGYKDQALFLYKQFGEVEGSIKWEEFTDEVVRNALSPPSLELGEMDWEAPLPALIQQALSTKVSTNDLARLIRELEGYRESHPTLLKRFKERFTSPPSSRAHRRAPHRNARLYFHAEIINLGERGQHEEAVRRFAKEYLWVGLPPHPLAQTPSTSTEGSTSLSYRPPRPSSNPDVSGTSLESHKAGTPPTPISYPSIHLITSLLPSIFATLPAPSHGVVAYHKAYLAQHSTLPPTLQPRAATHATFIRGIITHRGPAAGLKGLKEICRQGLNPGEAACAAVLFHFAARGRMLEMTQLLNAMERGDVWDGVALPKPTKWTYEPLKGVLQARMEQELVREDEAEKYRATA